MAVEFKVYQNVNYNKMGESKLSINKFSNV